MNADQPGELFERSEFSAGRHSSVRRRAPDGRAFAAGGPDGGTLAFLRTFVAIQKYGVWRDATSRFGCSTNMDKPATGHGSRITDYGFG